MAEKPVAEIPTLSKFKDNMIKDNSIITIIGKNTNIKAVYKSYGQYFDSIGQLKNIIEMMGKKEALVIDETCPRNRIEDLLYVYELD